MTKLIRRAEINTDYQQRNWNMFCSLFTLQSCRIIGLMRHAPPVTLGVARFREPLRAPLGTRVSSPTSTLAGDFIVTEDI